MDITTVRLVLCLGAGIAIIYAVPAWTSAPHAIAIFAGALLAIPLLFLVPLPPGTLEAMPGRDTLRLLESALALESRWRPLAIDPVAGWLAWGELLLPVAAFLIARRIGAPAPLFWLLAGFAILQILLGGIQVATGGMWQVDTNHAGDPTGIFANRNHFAVGLAALVPLVMVASHRQGRSPALGMLVVAAFVLAVIASGSRAGFILLLLSIPAGLALIADRPAMLSKGRVAIGAALVAGLAALLFFSRSGSALLARLVALEVERPLFWRGALDRVRETDLIGDGPAGFARAYAGGEPLETVRPGRVLDAHSDPLQWLVELGAGAMVLVALGLWALVTLWRRAEGRSARAAVAGLVILLLGSLVDYPLRTSSLAVMAALLAALALPPARRRWSWRMSLVALAFLVIPLGAFAKTLLATDTGREARLAMIGGNADEARTLAREALALDPYSSEGWQALIGADLIERSDETRSHAAAARRLGWRNGGLQFLLLTEALSAGDMESVAKHSEALLRGGLLIDETLAMVRPALAVASGREAFAVRIARDPEWARPLLRILADLDREQLRDLAQLLELLGSKGAPDPEAARLLQARAFALGDREIVTRLAGISHAGSPSLEDEALSALVEGGRSVLGWRVADTTRPRRAPDGIAFRLAPGSEVRLLSGQFALESGLYEIAIDGDARFAVRNDCADGRWRRLDPIRTFQDASDSVRVSLPVEPSCQLQRLEILAANTSARPRKMVIQSVTTSRKP